MHHITGHCHVSVRGTYPEDVRQQLVALATAHADQLPHCYKTVAKGDGTPLTWSVEMEAEQVVAVPDPSHLAPGEPAPEKVVLGRLAVSA